MTVLTMNVANLKRMKNSVIGNPTAKAALAKDEEYIITLVQCINDPTPYLEESQGSHSQDDIRIEAAHIISSISYGSSDALKSLLQANALQAFIYAISNFQPTDSPSLKSAFARAFRAIAVAVADTVGPSQWGLKDYDAEIREEAKLALNSLFEVEAMDIYLPLLDDTSLPSNSHTTSVLISICQLLGSTIRLHPYRLAVSEWLPPMERTKEVKGKRGWEKPESSVNSPSRSGGWVSKRLLILLGRKDIKLQEAVLSALSALTKENPTIASKLVRAPPDQTPALSSILALCKSRIVDLQLAACLCATNIIRAGYTTANVQQSAAMTIIHILNGLISSESESIQTRTKACYILYNLISDDKDLCQLAYERGSLTRLANVIKAITPIEPATSNSIPTSAPTVPVTAGAGGSGPMSSSGVEWDEDEPESISSLREAALSTLATLALFDNDIRCEITDTPIRLLPYIQQCLSHPHIGVRYAACQVVRALSRAVAVLRTSVVDSGLGMCVFGLFMKQERKGSDKSGKSKDATGEDRRVIYAASAVVCNLVNDCSPLRPLLIEQGVIPRLVQLLHSDDPGLRLNALWAFKNLLYKSNTDLKRKVMDGIEWNELIRLLGDSSDPGIQEQAFHVVRHLSDGEEGIDMLFHEIGSETLMNALSTALEIDNDDVLLQAVCVLGNISNSITHQAAILSHPSILLSLRSCLVDSKVEIRRPAASCVLELIRTNPKCFKEIHEAGIDTTLRGMCDYHSVGPSPVMGLPGVVNMGGVGMSMGVWGTGYGASPGGLGLGGSLGLGSAGGLGSGTSTSPGGRMFQMGAEDDREVKDKAREALHWLEHGVEMSMGL
ncbi:armadillo-type protein [Abortiporus biennis]|nr:armadillo-type protein [Abortiporus biennis]